MTTFTASFTVTGKNAHEELNEIARILAAIADQFDLDHSRYAGATTTDIVYDIDRNEIGLWKLT
jgi:hypothetical protein